MKILLVLKFLIIDIQYFFHLKHVFLFHLYFSVKVLKGPRNSVTEKGDEMGESERFCYIGVIMRGWDQ